MGKMIRHKVEVPLTKDEIVRLTGVKLPDSVQNVRSWITGARASQYTNDLVGITVNITWETDG